VTALHSKLKKIREMNEKTFKKKGLKAGKPTELQLLNNDDTSYTGPAYLGTPYQSSGANSKFVYDTGSGFLTVTGSNCSSCTTKMYNAGASSTSQVGFSDYSDTQLTYGSASLNGAMYTDNMAINSTDVNTTVSNFGFFVIKSQTGLDGLDGILGFSPITGRNTGPSYVKFLYDQQKIPTMEVAF